MSAEPEDENYISRGRESFPILLWKRLHLGTRQRWTNGMILGGLPQIYERGSLVLAHAEVLSFLHKWNLWRDGIFQNGG